MRVQMMELTAIRPYENNPRRNDGAIEAVARSIREFGFRQPIVVDREGVIIAGHTTYKAAKRLGLRTVPVHVADDLSPEQTRAYRLADNKTGELATWNDEALAREIQALAASGLDLAALGFTFSDADGAASTGSSTGN